jgi:hypothetical protein
MLVLGAATVCAWMTSTSLAATVKAVADNRSGSILAFDGSGDPVQSGFNIDPGQNDYDPITFNECVIDNGRQGCMNVTSQFVNIGPGNVVDGFTASGSLNASKPTGAGQAISDAFLSVQIQVSGLAAGQTAPFNFSGALDETNSAGVISVTGPGVNFSVNSDTTWNQVLNLGNGTYSILIDANASVSGSAAATQSLTFSFSLVEVPPPPASCGSAGSCFLPKLTPGCDDAACCASICAADPFCCNSQWDQICADSAGLGCAQVVMTKPFVNPDNGRTYQVASPKGFADSNTFAVAQGFTLADIVNGRENAWIAANLASNVPNLNFGRVRVGLNDVLVENVFTWTTGVPFSYSRWAPSEPNNAGNEDSVEVYANRLWNDTAVALPRFAALERGSAVCIAAAGSCFSTHGPGCDDESCCNEVCTVDPFCCATSWDSACVNGALARCNVAQVGATIVNPATRSRYIRVSSGSWTQAEQFARSLNGNLVTIDSAAENEWLRLNFIAQPGNPSQYWIGFSDRKIENAFQWVSNEPVGYTNWGSGEPNNSGGAEDFALMNPNGTWNDIPAGFNLPALIEIGCIADFDGNNDVGGSDLGFLLGQWGTANATADLNADSIVDAADLAIFLGSWGACPTSNACTPRSTPGSDQPGCTACICAIDPFCCNTSWDSICVNQAQVECVAACQCGQ